MLHVITCYNATSNNKQFALQWCHNGCYSVSNHQPHDCLLNRLFRRRSKKTSKLRVTGLYAGNSPETSEFPAQMASNAEKFPFDDVIMGLQALAVDDFTNSWILKFQGTTLNMTSLPHIRIKSLSLTSAKHFHSHWRRKQSMDIFIGVPGLFNTLHRNKIA